MAIPGVPDYRQALACAYDGDQLVAVAYREDALEMLQETELTVVPTPVGETFREHTDRIKNEHGIEP